MKCKKIALLLYTLNEFNKKKIIGISEFSIKNLIPFLVYFFILIYREREKHI